ncbi:hypothetical protein LCL96_07760 [Rossellomorea aquimaris]|uniref:hypothetical protein n=1 Tax=Rossellomorea TaxID=2837508 RepID=UPI001CD21C5A|nr:hypothetical protein [Rossellomorea aquimaris]MCA1058825.1 hypothetical protein [Rossellomorea aquimaris]
MLNIHDRYSIVLYQTYMARNQASRHSSKITIQMLSQYTGFSEEIILEALEFGKLSPDLSFK